MRQSLPSALGGRVGVVGIVPSLGDARAPFFTYSVASGALARSVPAALVIAALWIIPACPISVATGSVPRMSASRHAPPSENVHSTKPTGSCSLLWDSRDLIEGRQP